MSGALSLLFSCSTFLKEAFYLIKLYRTCSLSSPTCTKRNLMMTEGVGQCIAQKRNITDLECLLKDGDLQKQTANTNSVIHTHNW